MVTNIFRQSGGGGFHTQSLSSALNNPEGEKQREYKLTREDIIHSMVGTLKNVQIFQKIKISKKI
jgi:actin-related protein